MAITVTDNRTLVDEADSVTGWGSPVGGGSPALFTADPYPKETTGHIGVGVSTAEVELLFTLGTSVDLSAGTLIYVWTLPQGIMQTKVNYGVAAVVGDGTNTNAYQVGGADAAVFRHYSGSSVNYQCLVIDTGNLPAGKALRGALASLVLTAITEFGIDFVTTVKAVAGVENCYVDVIRYGNGGLTITGTDTINGFLDDLAILDASLTTGQSYGICRSLGGGVFGVQGKILLGDTGTGTDTLTMQDQSFNFENFSGLGVDKLGITIQGGTGTQTIKFINSTLFSPVGSGAFLTASDIDVNIFFITGCNILNFDQSITLSADATNAPNHDISSNKFVGCAQINIGKTAFKNNTIDSTVDANGGMLIDTNTLLTNVSDLSFISDGTGHAIYITATGTYTFTNFTYSGYGADGTTDAVVYNNSGGAVTINVSGGGSPTVRNGTGASTTVVAGSVTTAVNVKALDTGLDITGARVLIEVTDGTNFPYQDSITITGTGTTATVTHTAHGLVTGDKIIIRGAIEDEYNGVYAITVTGVDNYTYTTSETIGTTPATGTIIATFAIIHNLTDASGNVSDTRVFSTNQLFSGRVRKSSASPYYKSFPFTGTVDSSSGFSLNVSLVKDE